MAVIDSGASVSGKANVDTNFNLQVRPPTNKDQTGFVGLAGIVDGGGSITRVRAVHVTEGNQQSIAPTVYLWDDTFNATALNSSKYRFMAATQTGAQAGGFLILNNSSITTINTNSAIQTFRTFPLFAKSETRTTICLLRTVAPQANCTEELGLLSAALPGGAAPTDGVFFRWNTAAELRGVINFNGVETQTAAITSPSINVTHDYTIVTQTNTVLFYIDDVLVGVINLLTDAPTLGQPFMAATQPLTVRQYIGGSAPALANQLKITDVFVVLRGGDAVRSWPEVKAGFGHMGYQGQNGGTMGTIQQNANNTNPAAAVPANTAANLGTGLGGKFQETLTLAAGTDGIIQSFQNPTGSVNQTPRNLVIRGVSISGVITVALTTNPLVGILSLNYGHTAVSLGTAESGSFASGGAKAPRRVVLGAVSISSATAAVGTQILGVPFSVAFASPIVVHPGEFVAVSHIKVTTAPGAGAVMWTITYDCYFE